MRHYRTRKEQADVERRRLFALLGLLSGLSALALYGTSATEVALLISVALIAIGVWLLWLALQPPEGEDHHGRPR